MQSLKINGGYYMSKINKLSTLQFAVCTTDKKAVVIGRTSIMQPKPNYKGGSIKWFDDRKLIRGGGAK